MRCAVDVVVGDDGLAAGDADGKEAALDAEELVFGAFVVGVPALGVFVGGGAAGELVDFGDGVDGVVLPVAVAVDGDEAGDGGEEVAEFLSFVGEAFVGVVVVFIFAVGADDGGGGDEGFEGGIGFGHGFLEPGPLFFAEDGFIGAVWLFVWRAVVAAFGEPDLEVFSPTEGAVGFVGLGDVFVPELDALVPGEVAVVLAWVAVVFEEVVVIMHPVGGDLLVEGAEVGEGVHAVPAVAGEGDVF